MSGFQIKAGIWVLPMTPTSDRVWFRILEIAEVAYADDLLS